MLDIPPSATLLLGMALLIFVLLRRAHRYQSRSRARGASAPRSPVASISGPTDPLSDAPPEILRWRVAMHETARDLKAELDSKISVLQALVGEARRERERLSAALSGGEPNAGPPGPSPRPATQSTATGYPQDEGDQPPAR